VSAAIVNAGLEDERDAGTTTPGSFHAPVVAEFELPES
jgi:hypothetical protein